MKREKKLFSVVSLLKIKNIFNHNALRITAPAPVETEFLERTEIDIDFEQPLANMESTSEQCKYNR